MHKLLYKVLYLLLFLFWGVAGTAFASQSVAIVGDVESKLFKRVTRHLNTIDSLHRFHFLSADKFHEKTTGYYAVISIGSSSSITIQETASEVLPIIYLLVDYNDCVLLKNSWSSNDKPSSCLTYNQSPDLIKQFLASAFNQKRRLFLGYSSVNSPYGKLLTKAFSGYEINRPVLDKKSRLDLNRFRHSLTKTDIFLALPDKRLFNSNQVQSILINTYSQKIPLIGFPSSFSKAGAVPSLYTDLPALVDQTLSQLDNLLQKSTSELSIIFPSSVSISINNRVARSLGVQPPDDKTILPTGTLW
jgi:ABC-type uncharacterized transport system substrate-binding protein